MRPYRVDAPTQVVPTRSCQRIEKVAVPAALVALHDDNPASRAGQVPVGGGHERVEGGHEPFACGHQHFPSVGQPLVPHVEGCRDFDSGPAPRLPEQRGALTQDPVRLVGGPRSSASSTASASSRTSRRPFGPPLMMTRSSGEKMVHGAAAASSRLPLTDLRFTLVRLRPTGRISASTSVGLSRPSSSAAHDGALRPGPHHRLGRGAPERPPCPQVGQGLEDAGLPGAVRPGDDRRSLGLEVQAHGAEDTKVGQLQVPDAHRDRGPLRRPGPASGDTETPGLPRHAPWPRAKRRLSRRSPRHRRPPRHRRSDTTG